jgi:hypothetical protein
VCLLLRPLSPLFYYVSELRALRTDVNGLSFFRGGPVMLEDSGAEGRVLLFPSNDEPGFGRLLVVRAG